MNGVMTPGVSAGSSHVGARVTWTAMVICPLGTSAGGASARAGSEAMRAIARATTSDERRWVTADAYTSSLGERSRLSRSRGLQIVELAAGARHHRGQVRGEHDEVEAALHRPRRERRARARHARFDA